MQKIYCSAAYRKVIFINLLIIIFQIKTHAQADSGVLLQYLKSHATVFDLSDRPDSVINRLMDGKKLFIYGQGGSHILTCNLTIPDKVVKSLSQIKGRTFRNYFIEWGRAMAYCQNLALRSRNISTYQIFEYYQQRQSPFWDVYLSEIDSLKKFFNYAPPFQYVGIDFERDKSFYKSIQIILNKSPINNDWLKKSVDTSNYFHLAPEENYKQEEAFVQYYKQLQEEFYKDSSSIKITIGNEAQFNELKYLMSNKNLKSRYENRNAPIAKNILEALEDKDPKDINFLCIGMAHSLLKYNYTVASKLNRNATLKGEILNMNLYCLNCHTQAETPSNDLLDNFMKHDEIKDFITAAEGKGDMVLFDLTQLPKKYEYLKDCGDLMLLVRNQQ